MTVTIDKPTLILVEGPDDRQLVEGLLFELALLPDVQIEVVNGTGNIEERLQLLYMQTNFRKVKSCLIIRDADGSYSNAEKSVQDIFRRVGLQVPKRPGELTKGAPNTGFFIFPVAGSSGTVEDLILEALKDKKEMECVDAFVDCLHKVGRKPKSLSKTRLQAFIAGIPDPSIRSITLAARTKHLELGHACYEPIKMLLIEASS